MRFFTDTVRLHCATHWCEYDTGLWFSVAIQLFYFHLLYFTHFPFSELLYPILHETSVRKRKTKIDRFKVVTPLLFRFVFYHDVNLWFWSKPKMCVYAPMAMRQWKAYYNKGLIYVHVRSLNMTLNNGSW